MSFPIRQAAVRAGALEPRHSVSESPRTHQPRPRERGTTHDGRVLFVAVVVAWDRVRFTASAASRPELVQHVARYVRRHADDHLWPPDAREVRALLDGGRFETAVERYFALVGGRWDKEWLIVTDVDVANADADDAHAHAAVAGAGDRLRSNAR
jgi:hypothetical protein